MKLSSFGEKFSSDAGILSLMDDLGNALAAGGENLIMMGGGNPGHIPEVETLFRQRLQAIAEDPATFQRIAGIYDPPQGEKSFIRALVKLLNHQFGWSLSERHIGLTNGSQQAFFMLFNMLAGQHSDGTFKQIQFPLAPEYIGYADTGLAPDLFTASRPRIERLPDNQFKYRVDFDHLVIPETTAALCVSRPTNPTGNVLTDREVERLDALAKENAIPLILDSAYGTPFPNIIFSDATPIWNENIILSMSLSKLGLPAARTGIVIAQEEIIQTLASINAVVNLTTGSFGALLTNELVETGEIIEISQKQIRPFYQRRAQLAVSELKRVMGDTPYRVHKPEGAIFLWLWFEDLPISSAELYERLKARGVIVVSGHYFFPGLAEDWQHTRECIRVTYAQDADKVKEGLAIIAEEVRNAYRNG